MAGTPSPPDAPRRPAKPARAAISEVSALSGFATLSAQVGHFYFAEEGTFLVLG